MLTANRTRGGRGQPRLVAEPQRDQQDVARQPLQGPGAELRHGRDHPQARAPEHHQAGAHAGHGPPALGHQRVRAPEATVRGAVPQRHRRQQHERQQSQRGDRSHHQRVLVAAEEIDRREHDSAQNEQGDDVEQRLGDDGAEHHRQVLSRPPGAASHHQRPGGLAQAGRQGRGHEHPDERPLHGVGHAHPGLRQRRAQDRVPGDGAQRHGRAHHAQAQDHERRAGGEQRVGDVVQPDRGQRLVGQQEHGHAEHGHRHPAADGGHHAAAGPEPRLEAGQPARGHVRLEIGRPGADGHRDALRDPDGRRHGDRLLVGAQNLLGHPRPGEAPAHRDGGAGHLRAAGRFLVEVAQGLGKLLGIAGRDQHPVEAVAHDVAVAGDVGGDHRCAGGERLGQHHAEALAAAAMARTARRRARAPRACWHRRPCRARARRDRRASAAPAPRRRRRSRSARWGCARAAPRTRAATAAGPCARPPGRRTRSAARSDGGPLAGPGRARSGSTCTPLGMIAVVTAEPAPAGPGRRLGDRDPHVQVVEHRGERRSRLPSPLVSRFSE